MGVVPKSRSLPLAPKNKDQEKILGVEPEGQKLKLPELPEPEILPDASRSARNKVKAIETMNAVLRQKIQKDKEMLAAKKEAERLKKEAERLAAIKPKVSTADVLNQPIVKSIATLEQEQAQRPEKIKSILYMYSQIGSDKLNSILKEDYFDNADNFSDSQLVNLERRYATELYNDGYIGFKRFSDLDNGYTLEANKSESAITEILYNFNLEYSSGFGKLLAASGVTRSQSSLQGIIKDEKNLISFIKTTSNDDLDDLLLIFSQLKS
jgi:hypothetical protein